ncbi:hypothetical protein GGD40_004711 [Paraburkholderia bryophila]|uniref:Uncharacterized protein n=1 Tax=Paraburkholderia bryophila TaxID=420952 RepID=A0A7Y9WRP0_9BURK|nr:hypothetical protein [Paraburkholderia bryophila]
MAVTIKNSKAGGHDVFNRAAPVDTCVIATPAVTQINSANAVNIKPVSPYR